MDTTDTREVLDIILRIGAFVVLLLAASLATLVLLGIAAVLMQP